MKYLLIIGVIIIFILAIFSQNPVQPPVPPEKCINQRDGVSVEVPCGKATVGIISVE